MLPERDEKSEWQRLLLATARAVRAQRTSELAKMNMGMSATYARYSDSFLDEIEEALKPFDVLE